jgi:hypothetical protein
VALTMTISQSIATRDSLLGKWALTCFQSRLSSVFDIIVVVFSETSVPEGVPMAVELSEEVELDVEVEEEVEEEVEVQVEVQVKVEVQVEVEV